MKKMVVLIGAVLLVVSLVTFGVCSYYVSISTSSYTEFKSKCEGDNNTIRQLSDPEYMKHCSDLADEHNGAASVIAASCGSGVCLLILAIILLLYGFLSKTEPGYAAPQPYPAQYPPQYAPQYPPPPPQQPYAPQPYAPSPYPQQPQQSQQPQQYYQPSAYPQGPPQYPPQTGPPPQYP